MPFRSVVVHSPCDADNSLPSVDVIQAAQRKAVADLSENLHSFPTTFGKDILADDDLFRVRVGCPDVLCIPSGDKALRFMVCADMRSVGHRSVSPTLYRLNEYCVWSHMESHVREFVPQCLHCVYTRAGEIGPRPYGDTVHGTAPGEVVYFAFLYVGSSGP